MNVKRIITGRIIQGKKKICFVAEDFIFVFTGMNGNDEIELIPDKNGYIWGETDQEDIIAVYIKDKISISSTRIVNTWNYIIAKGKSVRGSFDRIRGIRFINGTIKSVFPCKALEEDFEAEEEIEEKENRTAIVYKSKPDQQVFKFGPEDFFNISQSCVPLPIGVNHSWRFFSIIEKEFSIIKGKTLKNATSCLDIEFGQDNGLDAFYDFYGYVISLMSFLVFRKDAYFEKVELLREHPQSSYLKPFAECFVKKSTESEESRLPYNVININSVDEKIFKNMILSIVIHDGSISQGQYVDLPVRILPDSKEAFVFNVDKIMNICTCLEVELDSAKINLKRSDELNDLIEQIKKTIKEHKNGDKKLEAGVYDKIYGSMRHWGNTLSERIMMAWREHVKCLLILLQIEGKEYDDREFEKSVSKMVKTRNNVTHRGFQEIEEDVAETALYMYGLIYTLTLRRVGFSEEQIYNIFSNRLVL